jgi:uroporphyrinogen decarboxylase
MEAHMNKREVVLSLLHPDTRAPYTPAAFFLHFDPAYQRGQAAIDKHLEYFHYTGMDFLKVQYENRFPLRPEITKAADWDKMPCYGPDFYEDQWNIAEGLVKAAGQDALVIMTLYSPFMCAGHSIGKEILGGHLIENPEKVKQGVAAITESLLTFAKGCIERGIDGFYHSTQGGETHRFEGSPLFDECIRPYDLALMEFINAECEFNILHVCDYEGGYTDLTPFLDYPGDIVNSSLKVGDQCLTPAKITELFGRPFMGGFDRRGILATGSPAEIQDKVENVLAMAPNEFILGADCTVPGDTNWDNLKAAIEAAQQPTK